MAGIARRLWTEPAYAIGAIELVLQVAQILLVGDVAVSAALAVVIHALGSTAVRSRVTPAVGKTAGGPVLKLGKHPHVPDPRTVTLNEHMTLRVSLLAVPSKVAAPALSWGMLGNDRAGDCVWAGGDHETMLWNHDAGRAVAFTDANALADYGAVTGYPKTGDNGTQVIDALNYRRKTGLVDKTGDRHKLGAFAQIKTGAGLRDHIKYAVANLSAVGIGIQFPESAMDQFNAGDAWSVVAGAKVDGGHYVPVVGYDSRYAYVVTWGKVQPATWGFIEKYCDEAWALLSPELLKAGKSPAGLDMAGLTRAVQTASGT